MNTHRRGQFVPPSPEVMSMLFMDYLRVAQKQGISFRKYLQVIGYTDPACSHEGMDDGAIFKGGVPGLERIAIPQQQIDGELHVKVLLVDFDDREATVPPHYYEDLLFSQGSYPTGSMRDFYREVSSEKVDVIGAVHGWLRMLKPYSYYTNGESGTNWYSYPRNAPRMAEDAVTLATEYGIGFGTELDKLGNGTITALFIVHAGRGAEVMAPSLRGSEIWSHKWMLRNPFPVADAMSADLYLTVPEDCKVGVCAHELGHLAFQWQDFYDPNYDADGKEWDGCGRWDLMAGGSYNGGGTCPAHPVGLHKAQHNWIDVETITASKKGLEIPPYDVRGKVVRVESPKFQQRQYLLLENRQRSGFDFQLPGDGLLVWRVDERGEMEALDKPGLLLIQADGRHDLERPNDWNQGDAGDPFPGTRHKDSLSDQGDISTSFPGQGPSGITLGNIRVNADTRAVSLDITVK